MTKRLALKKKVKERPKGRSKMNNAFRGLQYSKMPDE